MTTTFDVDRYTARKYDGIIESLNRTGDTKVMWSLDSPAEVAAARAEFDAIVANGAIAYKTDETGLDGEMIRAFDETATRILTVSPLVGG